MTDTILVRKAACTLLCAGAVLLAGCNQAPNPQAANPAAAGTAPAPASSAPQAAYVPPTADQLYQMVAPIALFPDKLLAQVLAGSTYPDQIAAADGMVQQHPNLKGALLADAVNPQPWDPSVKGLTQFPSVLDQMAQNIQWTTSLGQAYANDPADVMNAIQVMRERAARKGNLRNSAQMRVVSQASAVPANATVVEDGGAPSSTYLGPAEVPAPQQTIEILPAQPDTVYVPQYNPQTVYGEPVAAYPGYAYVEPRRYSTGDMVAAGAIGFGVGIVVGALLEHHHDEASASAGPRWGWNSWGMNWGGARGNGGGWQQPAVMHDNTVYVSRSTTIVNRYTTNNINNSRTVENIDSNNRTVENIDSNNRNINSNNRSVDNSVHEANTDNRSYSRVDNHPALDARAAAAPKAMAAPMSMPHFGTPVRGAEPARFAHEAPAAAERPQPAREPAPAARENLREPMAHHATPAPMERAAEVARPAPRPEAREAVREAAHPAAREFAAPRPHAETEHAAARPEPARAMAEPRPAERVERAVQHPAPPAARPHPAPHAEAHPAAAAHGENGKPHAENRGEEHKRDDEQKR